MKNIIMVLMLAVMGKPGARPTNTVNASQPRAATAAALQAARTLAVGTSTPVIKRVDWALVCSSPQAIQVAYNIRAERSLESICRSVSYLQTSKFQYGDVYSDSTVKLASVEQVLFDYVNAVVDGDISESVDSSGTFNLKIVESKSGEQPITCRESGYWTHSQDVDLPANSSFKDIEQSIYIGNRFSSCDQKLAASAGSDTLDRR